jgi:NitT/TauT family transport system substrate-binding protein
MAERRLRRGPIVFMAIWLVVWTAAILIVLFMLGGGLASGCPSRWTGASRGPRRPISWPSTRAISRPKGLTSRSPRGRALDAIPKVATGAFPVGFADINSLIKFLDQNPGAPVTAR